MPPTLDDLLDDALTETDPTVRIAAVEALLPCLTGSSLRARAWAAATRDPGTGRSAPVLAALVSSAGPHERDAALAALRRLPASRQRFHGLAVLLPHLPGPDRQAVEDELIAALAGAGERGELLHIAGPRLTASGLHRAVTVTLTADGPAAVMSLRDLLPDGLRRTVLAAGAALADDQGRAVVLSVLAPALTTAEAMSVAPAARAITDPLERAATLTALGGRAAPLAAEALAAVQEFDGDEQLLSNFLPDLAALLSGPQRDELLDRLAAATSATTRMWTIGALAPYLDADQQERALAAVGTPEPESAWLSGAAAFLPHLPAGPRRRLQELCVRLMTGHGVPGGVRDLLPYLSPEQVDQVARLVIGPGGRLSRVDELLPYLSDRQVATALEAALARPGPAERAFAITALVPRLDAAAAARAATVLDDGSPVAFLAACGALAERVDGPARRALVDAGARVARRIPGADGGRELAALAAVAADPAQRDELLRQAADVMRAEPSGRTHLRTMIAAVLATPGRQADDRDGARR